MSHNFTKSVLALLAVIGLILASSYATAQSSVSGSISGTVTDSSGAVIAGASVKITNTDRGEDIRVMKTDSAGFYTAESLPLGTYSVTISYAGFKTEAVTGLVLHAADALTVNRTLVPGGVSEVVSVTAGEAQLNLEDATSSGLINSTQMNEMPLVTRNYETLMNLEPGVVYGGATDDLTRGPAGIGGASSTVNFSVNGGRSTSNNWTIDGADNVDRGANLTLYTYPSPDAIAEFKNLRGQYSAAFGRNASGQIDVVTKSGTNSIHGSAYEYLAQRLLRRQWLRQRLSRAPTSRRTATTSSVSRSAAPFIFRRSTTARTRPSSSSQKSGSGSSNVASNVAALVPQASERTGDFTQSGQKIGGVWTTAPVTVCTAYTTNPATQVNTCTATGTQVTQPLAHGAGVHEGRVRQDSCSECQLRRSAQSGSAHDFVELQRTSTIT